ncbi:MAG: FkbM family methyltransferase [Candidatus Zixiibacteriota bacterium]|nr:MAG: FkbM family methyltransferase [candidate division Zixibacteria bacterium]
MVVKKILKACRKVRAVSDLSALYTLWRDASYLQEVGFFESYFQRMPVDRASRALPWLTYAAIAFLEDRIRADMSVFEFGSGGSTLWWSQRVARVVSCEHDSRWYELMKPRLSPEVEYLYYDLEPGGDYSKAVCRYSREFDIILIDGRDRVNCAINSLPALKPAGVIIWDNSDRERYRQGCDHLAACGFKRLDFGGFGPISASRSCTSVFYRLGNCLGI